MNLLKHLPLIFLITFPSCQMQTNNSWIHLFNGTDLTGWNVLNGAAEYLVKDNAIVGISKLNTPNIFLATTKEYSDFILVLRDFCGKLALLL